MSKIEEEKREQQEARKLTYVEKRYASVVVGYDQVLRLYACLKPSTEKPWGIDVFYGVNEEHLRLHDDWYNLFFESGFDVDQAVIIEFFIDDDYSDDWKLYGKGVEFFGAGCNCQYSMNVSLSPCRSRGEIVLYNIKSTYQFDVDTPPTGSKKVYFSEEPLFLPVALSFIAEYEDEDDSCEKSGVYLSQDPKIGIGKPRRP